MATHGEQRRQAILDAGLSIMRDDPARWCSVRAVARALGIAHQGILYHFGNAEGLRGALANHAVKAGDTVVIPYLIALRHSACDGMAIEVRARYLADC